MVAEADADEKRISALLLCAMLLMALLPTTTFAEGETAFYIGNAINYADGDDLLSSPFLTKQVDNITMEAWFKADTLSANEKHIRIMYNGNSAFTGYGIYLINTSPAF